MYWPKLVQFAHAPSSKQFIAQHPAPTSSNHNQFQSSITKLKNDLYTSHILLNIYTKSHLPQSSKANVSGKETTPIYHHDPTNPPWQDPAKSKGTLSHGGTKGNNWGGASGGSKGNSGGGSGGSNSGGGTKK
ncbi:hypothetical protein BDP81DRAFT_448449 [Colletotrichum phormii]|uniref:Uncharacterized protein n=1 Tax=Colletotrichum phormii TaxID=359342 RepID=A0AAI9ZUF2_9PEZI|nr:uncharacterized protein BDP81DRAFT_448449 [Colletotrichum phormii]KAK1638412.1 hypothetical protein BDP81DRAFT_448449 [Colletotrichum phormii]